MRKMIVLVGVSVLAGCGQSGSDGPQETAAASRFVGAWHLARFTRTAADGMITYPYGDPPGGQIMYTSSGQMSAQLMRPVDGLSGSAADGEASDQTQVFAYWGAYDVDETAGTVTHDVEGSGSRSWVGSRRVRAFRFEGEDRLILSPTDGADPSVVSELTWVRVPN